ncbi:MAG: hypothetical protein R6U29_04030 [Desulfosudaceae bacterium]
MENRTKRKALRIVSVALLIMGVMTVVPHGRAGDSSMLGYKALCTFTPISTIIILYVAFTIHRYLGNTRHTAPHQN